MTSKLIQPNSINLFVYGSLMSGYENNQYYLDGSESDFLGSGVTSGEYLLLRYCGSSPALVTRDVLNRCDKLSLTEKSELYKLFTLIVGEAYNVSFELFENICKLSGCPDFYYQSSDSVFIENANRAYADSDERYEGDLYSNEGSNEGSDERYRRAEYDCELFTLSQKSFDSLASCGFGHVLNSIEKPDKSSGTTIWKGK